MFKNDVKKTLVDEMKGTKKVDLLVQIMRVTEHVVMFVTIIITMFMKG
jgi:hypothetical protein